MSLFGQTKRHAHSLSLSNKGRRSPLPMSTSDAVHEKYAHGRSGSISSSATSSGWFTVVYVPLPRIFGGGSDANHLAPTLNGDSSKSYYPLSSAAAPPRRRVRLFLPIPPSLYRHLPSGHRCFASPLRTLVTFLLFAVAIIVLTGFRKHKGGKTTWTPPFQDPDTLVLTRAEVARIWEWELLSGHHPSSVKNVPESVPLPGTYHNPAVPSQLLPPPTPPAPLVGYQQRNPLTPRTVLLGAGPRRDYLPMRTSSAPWEADDGHADKDGLRLGFAPRPVPGSVMDLDKVYEKCSFVKDQYVRDCLEFLRIGGHLDNSRRVRRSGLDAYRYIYQEQTPDVRGIRHVDSDSLLRIMQGEPTDLKETNERRSKSLSRRPLTLASPLQPHAMPYTAATPCDPAHPRIFHMFWAGPFTDKPYMAVMSFLFTQNLGLDLTSEKWHDPAPVCRPQFWVWINPGPAAAVPNPSAKREMYEQLATNAWSAPFLHARFKDVVKFKMWNTTEQLDGIPELQEHWREMPIFNSGGNTYGAPAAQATPTPVQRDVKEAGDMMVLEDDAASTTVAPVVRKGKGGLFEKVGSSSESDYDRLSVILSDMARFVLTHRFGGVYLDADTIFLRDWEELWGWKGQFAYRWSWHNKYNTAVLKLHKGSALGTFLFKTALENGLDFHPMTVSRYLKDAGLENLLFRIPDALFDPAWLNMEKYQRDRPPFPYLAEFADFFSNNRFGAAGPQPLGFDGFYRGAFSYHFHNFWWLPFDPSRNFPDLGQRFMKGERALRDAAAAAHMLADARDGEVIDLSNVDVRDREREEGDGAGEVDEADLSWATVLKRTFEAYVRGERPNMYGEWLRW